jgi:hypothetical protein
MIVDTSWAYQSIGATTIQQHITGLYAAFYDRASDYGGMHYWSTREVGARSDAFGVTYEQAAQRAISNADAAYLGMRFAQAESEYFNTLYGSKTDAQFVDALYLNLAGRPAETTSGAIGYWSGVIQKYKDAGLNTRDARGSMVGEFVDALIETNPLDWVARLTPAENEMVAFRTNVVHNKIATSMALVGASAQPEGAFLNARVVGDEAFYAQVRALSGVSNDIAAVYEQMEEISAALASGSPRMIQPVGISAASSASSLLEVV